MAKALDEAISREKLIFAAASNNGSMRQMTFPAYLDRIICVNACDGLGTALNINPPPAKRDDKRLAILGENVESAWKCEPGSNNTMKIKTGTSVATPIAAAVAALILEIAIMPSNSAAESVFKRCLPYMRDSIGSKQLLEFIFTPSGHCLSNREKEAAPKPIIIPEIYVSRPFFNLSHL